MDGVDGEWVTEKKFINQEGVMGKAKEKASRRGSSLNDNEMNILRMAKLERVMVGVFQVLTSFGRN